MIDLDIVSSITFCFQLDKIRFQVKDFYIFCHHILLNLTQPLLIIADLLMSFNLVVFNVELQIRYCFHIFVPVDFHIVNLTLQFFFLAK